MILQKFELEIDGVLSEKIVWGWERLEEGEEREIRMCLKICHISPIKLKTRVFRELDTRKITCEKYISAQNLSREAFSRETVVKVFVWILCFQVFTLALFCGKSLVTSF